MDVAAVFDPAEQGRLKLRNHGQNNLSILRTLDSTKYFTNLLSVSGISSIPAKEGFIIMPDTMTSIWSFFCSFSPKDSVIAENDFVRFREKVHTDSETFWQSGGMIDFGKVKDPRAWELERRMILSLYLTKVNSQGSTFPQETGLTYNSWYGRPHIEMVWWHSTHFALWGRPEILEKQMSWYLRSYRVAEQIARRQGFKGVRWQKITDSEGRETASSVGSYLIWQQPHLIYFSELLYQAKGSSEIINKYKDLVSKTAEFMADFAWYDSLSERYILPGVITSQECSGPEKTFNPSFELAYWRWGLETAQKWRERSGLKRIASWDKVLNGLAPLPLKDGLYLGA